MYNSAIESFVEFCDDMMIAQESLKEMNTIFNKQFDAIEKIKKEINNSKGDYKKQIMLYKKGCNILKDLKSKVSSMDETQLERNISKIKTILKCATSITAAIAAVDFTDSIGAGVGVGILTGIGLDKLSKRDTKSKTTIMNAIDETLDQFELCIKALNNPKYKNDLDVEGNNDVTEHLSKIKIKDVVKSLQPLFNTAKMLILKESNKFAAKSGYNAQFGGMSGSFDNNNKKYTLFIEIKDNDHAIDHDDFSDIVDTVSDKCEQQILKYQKNLGCLIDINCGDCDDNLEMEIVVSLK